MSFAIDLDTPSPSPCPSRSSSPSIPQTSTPAKSTPKTTTRPSPSSSAAHHLNRRRPIPNSYWVTPHMVACEYPFNPSHTRRQHLDALLSAGVRTFIDLTEPHELLPYYPAPIRHRATQVLKLDPAETECIEYHRFPIPDRCLPTSPSCIAQIMDVIADNEERGRTVAVHCRGGIGRTGVVVGCWLVQSGRAKNGGEALKFIAEEWSTVEKVVRYPHSPETGPQFEFVQAFRARVKRVMEKQERAKEVREGSTRGR